MLHPGSEIHYLFQSMKHLITLLHVFWLFLPKMKIPLEDSLTSGMGETDRSFHIRGRGHAC